ncbi:MULTISPECIES: hypothetical protein [Halococcus]|uniref:Uncharacterized protein n=1 Tax=Halococcus salifodinae DSM 8989 TaxID=1227456 RepID=M0MXM8_9EURY|nr:MULTISPECIES: hypothetical protein [Halococcus]EMA50482.1 hypothetical protein C450_14898 [Halococcus salifodinae DSM 8989]
MTGDESSLPEPYDVCTTALDWAREREYAGWDPYDGLNSPYAGPFENHWFTRLVWMHGVNSFPATLHRHLSIPEERNPKGIALFALAHLELHEATGKDDHLDRAERLLDWLDEYRSPVYETACWGYNFDWQNARKFFLPAYHPSVVVTVFAAQAFVRHHRLTGDEHSLAVAEEACEFIRTEINTRTIDGHEAYTYTTDDEFVVINVNALAARLFALVAAETDDTDLMARADELIAFVLSAQEESGAWHYSMPADGSPISHDNFHTGFVLESLREYLDAGGEVSGTEAAYERGLGFYREHLFEPDGAPKFEHDQSYPRDAHAAAQSILTFVRDGRETNLAMAEKVLGWTVEHLFDEEGYFYRQQGRFLDDTTPYMRWSQAWMCYAMAAIVRRRSETDRP